MQHFRQHTLVSLLSLLVLAGLAGPSLHPLAHVNRSDEVSHQDADADPSAPRVEVYCPTCALVGTFHATTPGIIELPTVSYHTVVAALPPATVVVPTLVHFSSRAPPALLTLIAHA